MSNFSGINNFGSLTTQNGQRLTFKDFDLDGDNKVTKEEYEQVLKDNNIDQVELSSIDKDESQELSEEEFAVWEQKTKMQDVVNDYVKKQKDFLGDKAKYLPELNAGLKDYIEQYADDFTGAVSELANMFEKDLPKKYNELKSTVLANDPSTIKSNILEEIAIGFQNENLAKTQAGETPLTDSAIKTIMNTLQAEANTFIKNYQGNNLAVDLKAHLEEVLNQSDADKLQDALKNYYEARDSYGAFIDDTELEGLKESAKELLQTALDKGITVKLGAQTVSATNIDAVLSKYKDADELTNAIETFVASLSQLTKKEQVITDDAINTQNEADKAFKSVPGRAYKVDINDLNLPKDYYENKTKVMFGTNQFKKKSKETLDGLKEQIKEQITTMLKSKGIPFEKIENIFENIYTMASSETINETLNQSHGIFFIKKYNVKDLVDKFIEKFNTQIETQINEMNKSNKDMDLQDINYSVVALDKNGRADRTLERLLEQGGTTTLLRSRTDSYIENMITKLKPQLLMKAMAMCNANRIPFDQKAFETRFDNTSKATIATSNDTKEWGGIGRKINPQEITKNFVRDFSTNYTAWVENEKAKQANK